MPSKSDLIVTITTYLSDNKDWIFSGIGVTGCAGIFAFLKRKVNTDENGKKLNQLSVNITNTNNSNSGSVSNSPEKSENSSLIQKEDQIKDEKYYKNNTHILIVDDETKFKLPKILKGAGWVHSKLIKDIDNLDHPDVKEADILFVDVQGVGVELGFKDEGLGLVEALKEKYPTKKVVIYSVVSEGNRFHNAFTVCDAALSKNADPYQFQRVVEKFTFIGNNDD